MFSIFFNCGLKCDCICVEHFKRFKTLIYLTILLKALTTFFFHKIYSCKFGNRICDDDFAHYASPGSTGQCYRLHSVKPYLVHHAGNDALKLFFDMALHDLIGKSIKVDIYILVKRKIIFHFVLKISLFLILLREECSKFKFCKHTFYRLNSLEKMWFHL